MINHSVNLKGSSTLSILGANRISGVVYPEVLVMVGFGGRGLAAQVAREGPLPVVDPHVIFQVVRSVKGLIAYLCKKN